MADTPLIEDILDLLRVDWRSASRGRHNFNIPCPICDQGREKHCNINLSKQLWRCPKCDAHGNAVHLASYYESGEYELNRAEYSKKILEILQQLNTYEVQESHNTGNQKRHVSLSESPILPDEELHKVYSAMIKLPELALTDEHREKLMARGLSEEAIRKNEYCSFPNAARAFEMIDPEDIEIFRQKYQKVRKSIPELSYHDDARLILGANIASALAGRGFKLLGVPGFFVLGNILCLNYPAGGIGIPTRNLAGQIVGLQIRTDEGKTKYLTLSSKNLARGVSGRIARCHAPLQNPKFSDKPQLVLTEGPLKADVALHLLKEKGISDFAFLAIPGVTSTASFFEYCSALKKQGYKQILMALDMDKLTNPHVMRGSHKISVQLREMGFKVSQWLWDEEYAAELYNNLIAYYTENELKLPELPQNVFQADAVLNKQLESLNIQIPYGWKADTKGIDDFLKNAYNAIVGID